MCTIVIRMISRQSCMHDDFVTLSVMYDMQRYPCMRAKCPCLCIPFGVYVGLSMCVAMFHDLSKMV